MRTSGLLLLSFFVVASACAFEGPKLTRDAASSPVARTWPDVKAAIARSIEHTAEGYYAYSHGFNDIGPIDTAGGLTDEELHTQFAMACILASPITVRGEPLKPQLVRWLGDKMLMNVNSDEVARQGHVVAERDGTFVILKYLWGMNDANNAVAFYNPTDEVRKMTVTARELSLSGTIRWTDRFDPSVKGSFVHELSFDVPAHGARLVYLNGKPLLRSEYRSEDAFASTGRRVWRNVYVPASTNYLLTVGTTSPLPYRVKVNGLDQGEYHGAACLDVRLESPENTIDITGKAAEVVEAIWIGRSDSMLATLTAAFRLAHFGKDSASTATFERATTLPVDAMEPSGPTEELALGWIHEMHWLWQFDWLWARCAEANGEKAKAVEHIEKGCFRYRDRYGIEPEDPAFWVHYELLTGKKRTKNVPKADSKEAAATEAAPSCVEWQNEHNAELAAAVESRALDAVVGSAASADQLLASVKGAYETDPLIATKVAAVTAHVMERGRARERRVWSDALLNTALHSTDVYRTLFCLDQLRWCGLADQVGQLEKFAQTCGQRHVETFVAMLVRELKTKEN